jgi:hypothetical protein
LERMKLFLLVSSACEADLLAAADIPSTLVIRLKCDYTLGEVQAMGPISKLLTVVINSVMCLLNRAKNDTAIPKTLT